MTIDTVSLQISSYRIKVAVGRLELVGELLVLVLLVLMLGMRGHYLRLQQVSKGMEAVLASIGSQEGS